MKSEKVKQKRKRSKSRIKSRIRIRSRIMIKKLKRSINKIKPRRTKRVSKKLRRSVRKRSIKRTSISKRTRTSISKRKLRSVKSKRTSADGNLTEKLGNKISLVAKSIPKRLSVWGKIEIEEIKTSIKRRLEDIKNKQKEINETAEFFSKHKQKMDDYNDKETFEQKRQKIFEDNNLLINENIKLLEEISEEDKNKKISEQTIKNYREEISSMNKEIQEKENEMKKQVNNFNERVKKVNDEINKNNENINQNNKYLELLEIKKKNIIRLQQLLYEKEQKEKELKEKEEQKQKEKELKEKEVKEELKEELKEEVKEELKEKESVVKDVTENSVSLGKDVVGQISTNSIAQVADGSKKDGGWFWFWSSSPENEINKLNAEIKNITNTFYAKSNNFEATIVPEMNNNYIQIIESERIKKSSIETEKNNLLDQIKSKIDSIKDSINNKLIEIQKHQSTIKLCIQKINSLKKKQKQNSTLKGDNEELIKIIKKMYDRIKTNENNKAVIERKKREIEEFKEQATESCNDYLIPIKAYLQEIIKDNTIKTIKFEGIKEGIKQKLGEHFGIKGEIFTEEKFNNLQKELKLIEKCYVKVKGSDDKQININELQEKVINRLTKYCSEKYTKLNQIHQTPPPLPPRNNDGGFF